MKNKRKRSIVLAILLSILVVSFGASLAVYANSWTPYSPTLNQIDTDDDFHLATSNVMYFEEGQDPVNGDIVGNLFSFSHALPDTVTLLPAPSVSDSAAIVEWHYSNTATHNRKGIISGSFIIDKHWGEHDLGTGEWEAGGTIEVSFTAQSSYVSPYEGEDEETEDYGNYNFRGSFRITGGSEYYAGLRGAGSISGTFQYHGYGNGIEFVMMGKAFVR
jgi:hypothetical protein